MRKGKLCIQRFSNFVLTYISIGLQFTNTKIINNAADAYE